MRLIGLSVLQSFGAACPGAMPTLAALAAMIRAPEIRDSAMLETQLGGIITEREGQTLLLELADADCRVTLNVNDRLRTAQIVAVNALDENGGVE